MASVPPVLDVDELTILAAVLRGRKANSVNIITLLAQRNAEQLNRLLDVKDWRGRTFLSCLAKRETWLQVAVLQHINAVSAESALTHKLTFLQAYGYFTDQSQPVGVIGRFLTRLWARFFAPKIPEDVLVALCQPSQSKETSLLLQQFTLTPQAKPQSALSFFERALTHAVDAATTKVSDTKSTKIVVDQLLRELSEVQSQESAKPNDTWQRLPKDLWPSPQLLFEAFKLTLPLYLEPDDYFLYKINQWDQRVGSLFKNESDAYVGTLSLLVDSWHGVTSSAREQFNALLDVISRELNSDQQQRALGNLFKKIPGASDKGCAQEYFTAVLDKFKDRPKLLAESMHTAWQERTAVTSRQIRAGRSVSTQSMSSLTVAELLVESEIKVPGLIQHLSLSCLLQVLSYSLRKGKTIDRAELSNRFSSERLTDEQAAVLSSLLKRSLSSEDDELFQGIAGLIEGFLSQPDILDHLFFPRGADVSSTSDRKPSYLLALSDQLLSKSVPDDVPKQRLTRLIKLWLQLPKESDQAFCLRVMLRALLFRDTVTREYSTSRMALINILLLQLADCAQALRESVLVPSGKTNLLVPFFEREKPLPPDVFIPVLKAILALPADTVYTLFSETDRDKKTVLKRILSRYPLYAFTPVVEGVGGFFNSSDPAKQMRWIPLLTAALGGHPPLENQAPANHEALASAIRKWVASFLTHMARSVGTGDRDLNMLSHELVKHSAEIAGASEQPPNKTLRRVRSWGRIFLSAEDMHATTSAGQVHAASHTLG